MITTNYNTNTIKPRFATNIPELLNLQQTSLNSPIVQVVGVDDQNESGDKKKVDKFEINVNFFDNPGSLQQIYLILFFKLEFKEVIYEEMESGVIIDINSLNGISEAKVFGSLQFHQLHPIYSGGIPRLTYNYPGYYDENNQPLLSTTQIMENNLKRNETIQAKYRSVIVPGYNSANEYINIEVSLDVPKYQEIVYIPSISQIMKFAWTQYLSQFLVLYLFFRYWLKYFYENKIFSTLEKHDLPKSYETILQPKQKTD